MVWLRRMSIDDDLRALIGQAPAPVAESTALPDLDLAAFLSPTAQREIQAAQGLTRSLPSVQAALPDFSEAALSSLYEDGNQAMDGEIHQVLAQPAHVDTSNVRLGDIWAGVDREGSDDEYRPPAAHVEPDLQSLFMNREAQSAMEARGMTPSESSSGFEDFEFTAMDENPRDTDFFVPRRSSPGNAQGVVISQRTAEGFRTIERTRPDPRYVAPPRVVAAGPPRTNTPRTTPAPTPTSSPTPAHFPTLMQQLMNDD